MGSVPQSAGPKPQLIPKRIIAFICKPAASSRALISLGWNIRGSRLNLALEATYDWAAETLTVAYWAVNQCCVVGVLEQDPHPQ